MKQKLDILKNGISKYRKIVNRSLITAFGVAFAIAVQSAVYRMNSLKLGEYPEEPAEIIQARILQMQPIIVRDAIICFVLLLILFFVIYLAYWLNRDYNISLIHAFRTEFLKKEQS